MLHSYFDSDEIIYLYRSFNGKKYSKKDVLLLVLCIVFSIMAISCLVLVFLFTTKLLSISGICFLCAGLFLGYYIHVNKLYYSQNNHIDIEYAITNKKFIIYEKIDKKVFSFPINSYCKVFTRSEQIAGSKAHLVLRVDSLLHKHIPLHIHNENIEISNDGIVIYNLEGAFLLKYQLNFLFFLKEKNITNIYDSESFLEPDEYIVHTQEFKNLNKSQPNFIYLFLVLFPIVFVFLSLIYHFYHLPSIIDFLFELTTLFYLYLLAYRGKSIFIGQKRKNNKTYIRYIFTNKRILFLDYTYLVMYAFQFKYLDFVNISNYNNLTDTGNIFLSNYKHHISVKRDLSSKHSQNDDTYDLLFPTNYSEHIITFNFNVMDCPKIRLYNIKNPKWVVDNFIQKHVKDHETIKKMRREEKNTR